jgi:hypothetical protein
LDLPGSPVAVEETSAISGYSRLWTYPSLIGRRSSFGRTPSSWESRPSFVVGGGCEVVDHLLEARVAEGELRGAQRIKVA